jgi:hypothetical protein
MWSPQTTEAGIAVKDADQNYSQLGINPGLFVVFFQVQPTYK